MSRYSRNRIILYIAAAAAALVCAVVLIQRSRAPQGTVAVIQCGGEEIMVIRLDDAQDRDFSIADETGHSITFRIENHAIRFLSSDCPDKICVNTGFIRSEGEQACCLPNKTVLSIEVR